MTSSAPSPLDRGEHRRYHGSRGRHAVLLYDRLDQEVGLVLHPSGPDSGGYDVEALVTVRCGGDLHLVVQAVVSDRD